MEWVAVKNFEGLYEVSETGMVKSLRSGKILSQREWSGYYVVKLMRADGTTTTKGAHRLVMESFKPCENMDRLVVNHINHDKLDNRLENLEWLTNAENIREAYDAGLHTGKHRGGNNKKAVQCVETGEIYESSAAAARAVGIKSHGKISDAIRSPWKTSGGYHWKYPELNDKRG